MNGAILNCMAPSFTVYKISSPNSRRFYIGITKYPLKKRFSSHLSASRKGKKALICMWLRKYHASAVISPLISGLTKEEACDIEQRAIDFGFLYSKEFILNTATGGNASMLGRKHTQEARAKMSLRRVGVPKSDSHKEKIGAAHRGKRLTDRHKAQVSAARTGSRHSDESKAKMSAARKGKPKPEEWKNRMSEYWLRRRAKAA